AGLNSVSVAVPAAQAFARRDLSARFNAFDLGGGTHAVYSGSAILFTPGNELRLIENVPYLTDSSSNGYLETSLSGYTDISWREYIPLPQGAMAVGIVRDASAAGLILISPPFAVRFNPEGNLAFDAGNDAYVYYDANADGKIQTSSQRAAGYDPQTWDPR